MGFIQQLFSEPRIVEKPSLDLGNILSGDYQAYKDEDIAYKARPDRLNIDEILLRKQLHIQR